MDGGREQAPESGSDRREALALLAAASIAPGAFAAASAGPHGGEIAIPLPDGLLELTPLTDAAIRVRISDGKTPARPSLMLVDAATVRARPKVRRTARQVIVALPHLTVEVDLQTGALRFLDAHGQLLLAEVPHGRTLAPSTISGEPCFSVVQRFVSPPGERIYGSGQFQDGMLDIRGLSRRLVQVNTIISLPFFLSSRGFGLLWHNHGMTEWNPTAAPIMLQPTRPATPEESRNVSVESGTTMRNRTWRHFEGTIETSRPGRHSVMLDNGGVMTHRHWLAIDGKTVIDVANEWLPAATGAILELAPGTHRIDVIAEEGEQPRVGLRPDIGESELRSPVSDGVDYVVVAGETPDAIIAGYRKVTGQARLLPKWAFGYVHCRERFHSEEEIVSTAEEMRRRKLPMSMIVQDWEYWGRYGWNAMRFDERFYPDPKRMVDRLHALHVRLMVSVWSHFGKLTEDPASQFAAKNYLVKGTEWVDFFNPAAAAFFWNNLKTRMVRFGIDAWWLDATEPDMDALAGRSIASGAADWVRNAYPLVVNRTVAEGLLKDQPDRRPMIVTRCALSGQQRYGSVCWSGDIGATWDAMARQIPAGLSFCAAGMPWWTNDAGGFFRPTKSQYDDPLYHELLLRWVQYITFCPLQRVHGYQTDTEFWRFGEKVTQEGRRWLSLRARLVPYIYAEASRVTTDGGTLMRPLVMDFPADDRALDQKHQYMFGPAFHVAPVLAPSPGTWDVYLPDVKGGWIDFWTGEHRPGGQVAAVAAPLEQIPLHVRAGSIVPLGAVEQYVGELQGAPIELRIYPGSDGSFILYDDEGSSRGNERGEACHIPLRWDDRERRLSIGARQGRYRGMPMTHHFDIVLVGPGHGVGEQATASLQRIEYRGIPVEVRLA